MFPDASIVITTRNRASELRRALTSASMQSGSVEIVVMDDGSTDGTSDMVRAEFPQVRLHVGRESKGYIARRNEAAGLVARRNEAAGFARGKVIISIDDDAAFSTPDVVEQALAAFSHDRIGAVAIPFINVMQSQTIRQRAPDQNACYVTDSFIGTAHAVARELFLRLGGYREDFVHQGEELDFCLRMLDAGYVVRLTQGDPILHYESSVRDTRRMDFRGRRNDILFAWHNVPRPYLLRHLAGTTLNGLLYAIRRAQHPGEMIRGLLSGYAACIRLRNRRKPVRPAAYRLNRKLKKDGPLPYEQIEPLLPPVL